MEKAAHPERQTFPPTFLKQTINTFQNVFAFTLNRSLKFLFFSLSENYFRQFLCENIRMKIEESQSGRGRRFGKLFHARRCGKCEIYC